MTLWSFALGAALAACEPPAPPPPAPEASVPFAARFDPNGVYQLDPALPLAFRRDLTLPALKGDQFDDQRTADPENYAITAPPPDIANVRPMTEWEPMRALLIAYPSYAGQLEQASQTFVDIARQAADYGEVWVLVDGSQAETIFTQKLVRAGVGDDKLGTVIKFWRVPFDTYWFIDFGPLPLVNTADDTYAFGDFRYYHERPLDDAIPTLLGRHTTQFGERFPVTTFRMPLTMEGGTFQATSDGVCITGSRQIYNMSCVAGACRESILGLSLPELQHHAYADELRGVLAAYAGCKDLVVTHSISDDGTGHIDMYLKILDDSRILLGEYRAPFGNDAEEENAGLMNDNATFLEAYVKPDGGRFQVVRLPMPGHRTVQDFFSTYDVPFTYINSTFFNGLNLWPAYTFREWSASRDEAEAVWTQVLPDMHHVWIDAEELSYESGAIHCVTRTIPRRKATAWVNDGACEAGMCSGPEGAYDGACALSGASDLCWGPQWLCACNDCRECPAVVESPCGSVSWRGCCDGGDVLFCDAGQLQRIPCAGTGCGWEQAQGYYACGLSGEDPSGEVSSSCACQPDCGGRSCGDDGCGGSCGACEGGALCVSGECRTDCASCAPGEMGCEGAVSWRCIEGPEGCNRTETVDCAASGLGCDGGDCVSVAEPEPEQAEVVEASDSDTAGAPDATDTPEAAEPGPEAEGPDVRASDIGAAHRTDDGCKAGAGGGEIAFGSILLLVALARSGGRSRRSRACLWGARR